MKLLILKTNIAIMQVGIQNQIVRENIRLAYKFAHNAYLEPDLATYNNSRDDLFQSAAIGLVRATRNFNPNKAKLSTWAHYHMNHNIGKIFEFNRAKKRVKVSYAINPTSIASKEELLDKLMRRKGTAEYNHLYEAMTGLEKDEYEIFQLILEGYCRTEIARILKISLQRVNSFYHKGLRKLKIELRQR